MKRVVDTISKTFSRMVSFVAGRRTSIFLNLKHIVNSGYSLWYLFKSLYRISSFLGNVTWVVLGGHNSSEAEQGNPSRLQYFSLQIQSLSFAGLLGS